METLEAAAVDRMTAAMCGTLVAVEVLVEEPARLAGADIGVGRDGSFRPAPCDL